MTYVYSYVCLLSLTQSEECNRMYSESGCLALTNLNWIFRDAYLTCISANESCSDVTFVRLNTFGM